MSTNPRALKVADRIQAELAEILQREYKDPRLGFVTVTRVEMTPDLRVARIFVSNLDSDALDDSIRLLMRGKGFLRSRLGPRIRLRHIPELQFLPDRSGEHAQRVAELLRGIEEGRDFDEGKDED